MYQIKVTRRDLVREQRNNRVISRILSVTAYMPCVQVHTGSNPGPISHFHLEEEASRVYTYQMKVISRDFDREQRKNRVACEYCV
jgi:hypothetical protein